LLTEAARRAGCRAIIQCHAWESCGFLSDQQILYITTAPHQQIFPHCCAVLHHGGAGTTQSAMLAGKPSIVIAHISEQEHWGRELRRLGIAGKPLKRRSVNPAKLAAQIRHLRSVPAMSARAQAIAQAMGREHGVAEAVRQICQRWNAPASPNTVNP
jgi:UDP:flavonoid glycosyltransferase YjiC (YdhE family)